MDKTKVKKITKDILKHLDADAEIGVEQIEDNFYDISIEGEDLSYLIGYHGKTLNAFQHIINLILYKETKDKDNAHVNLDINGYKTKRIEKLHEIAKKYIDKARFFDEEIHMPTMSPWERKHIHMLISEYTDVETESVGEGEDRHIILRKKK